MVRSSRAAAAAAATAVLLPPLLGYSGAAASTTNTTNTTNTTDTADTAASLTFPGVAEFDVVFPRNETYAPGPIFPIVVAVQNLPYANLLAPLLNYCLYNDTETEPSCTARGVFLADSLNGTHHNSSDVATGDVYINFGTDPFFAAQNFWDLFDGVEGRWRLAWDLAIRGCTRYSDASAVTYTTLGGNGSVVFTTSRAAAGGRGTLSAADLVTNRSSWTTGGGFVGQASFAYNVSGTTTSFYADNVDPDNPYLCPVFAQAEPMAAVIDETTALGLFAAVQSTACAVSTKYHACTVSSGAARTVASAAAFLLGLGWVAVFCSRC